MARAPHGLMQLPPVLEAPQPADVVPLFPVAKAQERTPADATTIESGSIDITSVPFNTPSSRDISLSRFGDSMLLAGGVQTINRPEDPDRMLQAYDLSFYLAPLIQAIAVAVYQTGWQLEPALDLTRPEKEVHERVRQALEFELARGDFEAEVKIGRREIKAEVKRLQRRAEREAQFLTAFFARCCPDMSFERLLTTMGLDQELTGDGWWEVLRDAQGRPARFIWVPSRAVVAVQPDPSLVPYETRAPLTKIRWERVVQMRRFPRWAQIVGSTYVWFKHFGDPRVMSRYTGRYYRDLPSLLADEQEQSEAQRRNNDEKAVPLPATELLQFSIPYPGSAVWGKPDHATAYPAVSGGRDLAEENMKIVADEAIPSMMVLCAGGRIDGADQERIEQKITHRERGRKQILFINAFAAGGAPTGPSGTPTLKIEHTKPLQQEDALFMNYDKRVEAQAHGALRTPYCVLGKHDAGVTKDVLYALRRFFDEDVAAPKRRMQIDDIINTYILPALGIECWRYRSNSRPPTDPEAIGMLISKAMEHGWLTPDDARAIGGKSVFNRELPDLKGIWSELTSRIVVSILQTKNVELAAALMQSDPGILDKISTMISNVLQGKAKTGESTQVQEGDENGPGEQEEESAAADAGDGEDDG